MELMPGPSEENEHDWDPIEVAEQIRTWLESLGFTADPMRDFSEFEGFDDTSLGTINQNM